MKALIPLLLALALRPAAARAGLFPDGAFGDEARGLAGAQFLKQPPSARIGAMAGAGLALPGPDAVFLNPAGCAALPPSLTASWESLLADSYRSSLAFARPSGGGVATASLIYNDSSPGLLKLDGGGAGDGSDVAAYDMALSAGYARRYAWTDFGFSLKYVRSRLAGSAGATIAADAGFVFREAAPSRTELAVAVRNFGPPLRLGSEADPLPFEAAGGLRWKYTRVFDILAEGRLPSDHAPYLVFGAEWRLPFSPGSALALRTGVNFRNFDEHGAGGAFAGGFGVKLGGLVFDYAFSPYGELGAAHRMSAGLAWGAPRVKEPAAPLPPGLVVVVAPFYAQGGAAETEAGVVRNLLESELVRIGRYKAVAREKLDLVLAENRLAYAGLSPLKLSVELGWAAGADVAVFGDVAKEGRGYLLTARLVEVSSSRVLRTESARAAEDYLFRDAARRLASSLSR